MGSNITKDSLYEAINGDNVAIAEQILKTHQSWINERITDDCGSTPLGLATWRGNVEMIYSLLNLGADVNLPGSQMLTPVQIASRRGKDEALDFLAQKGGDIYAISSEGLDALDYAVIYCNYNIARKLVNLGLKLKAPEFYHELRLKKHPIYYDYKLILECIQSQIPLEECPPFNIPPPEKEFKDPVVDPRETWSHFFKRVIEFEDPPLVERSDLPQELQPQNRTFGKLKAFLFNHPEINPTKIDEDIMEEHKELTPRSQNQMEKNNNGELELENKGSLEIKPTQILIKNTNSSEIKEINQTLS